MKHSFSLDYTAYWDAVDILYDAVRRCESERGLKQLYRVIRYSTAGHGFVPMGAN